MKRKLTITIRNDVLEKSKEKAKKLGIPLSRLIENFLQHYVEPTVYCFKCGTKFKISEAKVCPRCGWYICPKCGACACTLGEEGAKVAFYMRKTLMEIFSTTEV